MIYTGTDIGVANAYKIEASGPGYFDGQLARFEVAHDNTGTSTFSISNKTPKNIIKPDGTNVVAGDLNAGAFIDLIYVAKLNAFQLLTPSAIGGAGDANDLGYFATEAALILAHATAEDGNFAVVGETDTIWVWDSGTAAWVDTNNQPTVPTLLSQFTNDVGFITIDDIPSSTGGVTLESRTLDYTANSTNTGKMWQRTDSATPLVKSVIESISGSIDLDTGLVAYWKFDEVSGNATDSVNSHTLTNDGSITFTTGKILNGANISSGNHSFTGVNNTDLNMGTGAFSFSFWIYNTNTAPYQRVYVKGNNGARIEIGTGYNGGVGNEINLYIYDGVNGQQCLPGAGTHSINVWEHWILTRSTDGTRTRIYKNGTLIKENTGQTARNGYNSEGIMVLGSSYNGLIDEFGIWKGRELTSTEATDIYNSGNGRQYPMNIAGGPAYTVKTFAFV